MMKTNPIYGHAYLLIVILLFMTAPLASFADDDEKKDLLDELKFTAKIDAFLMLSQSEGSDDLWGGSFNALLAPHYKINDRTLFILMYDGAYYKKREYYSDENGYLERTEFQSHDISPMVRIKIGDGSRFALTPSCFYTATFNKDVQGEDWGDGWYNYRDIGVGLDFTDKRLRLNPLNGIFKIGFQFYQRQFPNYPSLPPVDPAIPVEEDEKDYNGILTSLEYRHKNNGNFLWSAEYYMLYKMLTDKKVEDENGIPTDEDQLDHMHDFIFSMGYTASKALALGLDIDLELYRSNQNHVEDVFTGGEFTPDFYSYNTYGASPNLTYTFASKPVVTSFTYAYHKTNYTDRMAEDSSGEETDDKQYETQHDFLFKAGYEINKSWQVICKIQRVVVDSNNEDESIYKYNYTDNSYSVGVSYRY